MENSKNTNVTSKYFGINRLEGKMHENKVDKAGMRGVRWTLGMSQTRIRSASENRIHSNDWMRELEQDAQNVQAVLAGIDVTATKALFMLTHGDLRGAAIKLEEIREGLRLVCEITGLKMAS